jgi:hypothetical protein
MKSKNVFDLASNLHGLQTMYSKEVLTYEKFVELSTDEFNIYLKAQKLI